MQCLWYHKWYKGANNYPLCTKCCWWHNTTDAHAGLKATQWKGVLMVHFFANCRVVGIQWNCYGWLANHFAKCVTEWLLVLLVNSNSSHIDVEVSKFCRDQQINLYCIPTHMSHIIQHLDVVFFGALKTTWERYVKNTRLLTLVSLHGIPLTKYTFGRVFKDAWVIMWKCPHLWVLSSGLEYVQSTDMPSMKWSCTITAIFKQCQVFTSES